MAIHQSWRKALVVLLMFAVAIPKANANFIARTVVGNMLISGKGASVVLTPTARGSISTAVKAGTVPLENYVGATASAAGNGAAQVAGKTAVQVANTSVAAQVVGQITKADIAGAVVSCATGGAIGCAIGVATPLAIAYMSLSGARISPTVPNGLELRDLRICTVGPCYEFLGPYTTDGKYMRDPNAACEASVAAANALTGSAVWSLRAVEPYGNGITYNCRPQRGTDTNFTWTLQARQTTVQSPTWYPATPQEVKDALYKQNPAPAIVDELAKYGNITWTGSNVSVSGPAVVLGPQVVTTSQSGNKTVVTTSQDSTPVTYSGPTVTAGNPTTNTTRTITTKNPDGTTSTETETSSTTTTAGTEPETTGTPETGTKEQEEPPPTDTPLPPVPDLYTRKYPNGMEGIWNQYKDQLKNSQFMQLAKSLMPSVGDGGTCPAWSLNLSLASWADYGTHDVAPPCWVWDVAAAILVVSALLLARALVFGG